ncbi:DUF1684 domain-containing protein [Myroides odoratus]|uniref:DUF1684 domain-containing protein n=1 Tax=Myroides odoratus TaxID=256 RepID=UPI0039B0DB41
MKRLIMLGAILLVQLACTAPKTEKDKALIFQKSLNKEFAAKETSPLVPDALKKFKGLDFFPVNERFIIEATFTRTPDEVPFEMPTTTERKPIYVKYGEATFSLNGKQHTLALFQDINLRNQKEYEKHLFLPFTDLTSGVSTYGGGRYIDLEIPEGEMIILNFNLAYNPYCVYNPKFSCPIPPAQNDINAEINAGIKDYKMVK